MDCLIRGGLEMAKTFPKSHRRRRGHVHVTLRWLTFLAQKLWDGSKFEPFLLRILFLIFFKPYRDHNSFDDFVSHLKDSRVIIPNNIIPNHPYNNPLIIWVLLKSLGLKDDDVNKSWKQSRAHELLCFALCNSFMLLEILFRECSSQIIWFDSNRTRTRPPLRN